MSHWSRLWGTGDWPCCSITGAGIDGPRVWYGVHGSPKGPARDSEGWWYPKDANACECLLVLQAQLYCKQVFWQLYEETGGEMAKKLVLLKVGRRSCEFKKLKVTPGSPWGGSPRVPML